MFLAPPSRFGATTCALSLSRKSAIIRLFLSLGAFLLVLPLVVACQDDSNAINTNRDLTSSGGGLDLAKASGDLRVGPADLMPYNPINPAGLGPAPVALGASDNLAGAGAYVLLAKTQITNVTGSSITGGHLGLSPAAASFITGFSLVDGPSLVYSTSASVVPPGKIYAADYTSPTPSNLTTAVLAMEAAYSDAASRTNPDELNLSGGNLGGLTLAPGLYTWGSGVTIPADVTLAGGANDVWIFQISDDLDVSTGKQVVLSGAQAKNVYWQVAGQVVIHANAHVAGILLSKTQVTLQTSATLTGRIYAQALIALDNNAITAP